MFPKLYNPMYPSYTHRISLVIMSLVDFQSTINQNHANLSPNGNLAGEYGRARNGILRNWALVNVDENAGIGSLSELEIVRKENGTV